jgi:hypothetical protein
MTRRAPKLLLPASLALLLTGGCSSSPGLRDETEAPAVKIVDVVVLDAGTSASVPLPEGYKLLRSTSGDTESGNVNLGIWNDTVPASRVFIAYRSDATFGAVGISELHVASTDAAVQTALFGAAGHDALYGAANPGCAANPVDLNAATCRSANLSESYSGWCAFYFWDATCAGLGTPLFLHYLTEARQAGAIRCLVVGDRVAVDANQPIAARRAHIWWGPDDQDGDDAVTDADADRVLANVRWLKAADGSLVNLNRGTQSFRRYDWYDCGLGQGWDNAWAHAPDDIADAQYLGYCPP